MQTSAPRSWLMLPVLASCLLASSHAQPLPPASRTVFKCDLNGKVSYSDAPCPGAQRIEVQPTRGLNKSTGTERVGSDVQQERFHEAFAEGLKPITGMTPEQLKKAGQRAQLAPQAQHECSQLDRALPAAEKEEAALLRQARSEARDTGLKQAQTRLLLQRQRARELRC